jgi:hypothetical protein
MFKVNLRDFVWSTFRRVPSAVLEEGDTLISAWQ